MTTPVTEEILQQLIINKYSGNKTVFIDDVEYRIIKRIGNFYEVEELRGN